MERANYSVTTLCKVLEVSTSGFYHWLANSKKASSSAVRDANLISKLQIQHAFHRRSYGTRRHAAELTEATGELFGRKRVRRLMRIGGVAAKQTRKFKITTNSNHAFPIADNLLNRQFKVDKPNQVWVGDLTYLPTAEGWLYLVTVLDLFSRKIVGWSIGKYATRKLVLEARKMAVGRRGVQANQLFHSDRGSQYASNDYRRVLKACGFRCSMSRRGNCWDNAVAESFFATLEKELLVDLVGADRETMTEQVFAYIVYYNSYRRHSTLGNLAPNQFERTHRILEGKAA